MAEHRAVLMTDRNRRSGVIGDGHPVLNRAASGASPTGPTFGSRPIASAFAVAVGTVTSAPAIAASMSVLRAFFKSVPFAVRAPKQLTGVGEGVLSGWSPDEIGALERAVSFWHDSGGPHRPGGLLPATAARLSPSAPPLTRGSVYSIFRLPFALPVSG